MDFYEQFPNSQLNFDESFEDLLASFNENGITTLQLLTTSSYELAQIYQLDHAQLNAFVSTLKKEQSQLVPTTPTTKQLSFTTGDVRIDEVLGGGIKTGEITEIFGESATGKSQFIMQLSHTVQLPIELNGLDSQCVLISTEGMVETRRLAELMSDDVAVGLDNVFVINCNDLETQEHIINVQLPTLLKRNPKIKLIIVDSISHHIRVELGSNFTLLKKYLNELGSNLSNLAIEHNLSIVLTNQMSDKPMKEILNSDFKKINYDYQIGWLNGWSKEIILNRQENIPDGKTQGIATLGLDWDKFIDVKILLMKKYRYNETFHRLEELKRLQKQQLQQAQTHTETINQQQQTTEQNVQLDDERFWELKRWFKLIYSPRCSEGEIEFKIQKNGISTDS